jgi:epoxyqueuosine reductase
VSPPVPPDPLADFRAALRPHGLPLVGVADGDAARALGAAPVLEGAASVLVVASGGRAFWERLQREPDLRGLEHPIDALGQRLIGAALPALPAGARLLSQPEADTLDLRRLAALASVGWVSPVLELLLHPEYGPWLSIRGVVTLPVRLPPTTLGGPRGWDPCGPCARPCLDACPVSAYGRGHPFDVERCARHRLADEPSGPCASRCASRDACVVGPGHRYGDVEMRHRHRAGLPMIRAWLGS